MNKIDTIQEIFRDYFDEPTMVITEDTTVNDIEEWDSIAQMNLIVALEKEFNMKFKIDEIAKASSVSVMLEIIKTRI